MSGENRAVRELATRLIAARVPIALCICAATAFFAWRALLLPTLVDLDDLGPRRHPFLATDQRHADAIGGRDELVILVEATEGHLFTPERLAQLFEITKAVDAIPGVNHDRVTSIAHRTARVLEPTAGSALRSVPLMRAAPRTEEEAERVRRAVRKAEHLYGVLVSRDETAALVRAKLVADRTDSRRALDRFEAGVLVPLRDGWVGALLSEGRDGRVRIDDVFGGSAAAASGLRAGDVVTRINGEPAKHASDLGAAVAAAAGAGVEVGFEREGKPGSVTLIGGGSRLRVSVAGGAALEGWIDRLASRSWPLAAAAAMCAGALAFLYFSERRAVLRCAVTAALAAVWALGLLELFGVGLDPLALVAPVFLTGRAFVHALQASERYHEEIGRAGGAKRDAVVASYAATFFPAVGAFAVDAAAVLAMTLVPFAFVQKLAITAACWIAATAVAELVVGPIVLDALRPPSDDTLERRSEGELQRFATAFSSSMLAPYGRALTVVVWMALALVCARGWQALSTSGGEAASPPLASDTQYAAAHDRIGIKFGGVDSFAVMVEGRDKNALKDPRTLGAIEALQRHLERDPAVGYSVSLADVVRSANGTLHDADPRWAVIPNRWTEVGGVLFAFFGSAPPAETAGIVSGDYRDAPVTFFLRDRSPGALRRVVARAREFIEHHPMDKAELRLAGGSLATAAAALEAAAQSAVLVLSLGVAVYGGFALFATRSFAAALLVALPPAAAGFAVAAAAAATGRDLDLHAISAVALGAGLVAHLPIAMIARIVERYRALEDAYGPERGTERIREAALEATASTGKALAFGALVVCTAAAFWTASDVRLHADTALLLAVWTAVAAAASVTLVPALIVSAEPAFVARLAASPAAWSNEATARMADAGVEAGRVENGRSARGALGASVVSAGSSAAR